MEALWRLVYTIHSWWCFAYGSNSIFVIWIKNKKGTYMYVYVFSCEISLKKYFKSRTGSSDVLTLSNPQSLSQPCHLFELVGLNLQKAQIYSHTSDQSCIFLMCGEISLGWNDSCGLNSSQSSFFVQTYREWECDFSRVCTQRHPHQPLNL